jgi:hypothetical protein
MTILVSEAANPKPRQECDTALNSRSRLMMPRVEPSESLTAKLLGTQRVDDASETGSDPLLLVATDPLIQGLVDRLPAPDGIWSLDDRAKWLRTAASVFGLVYKTGDEERREIRIVFAKPPAEPTV